MTTTVKIFPSNIGMISAYSMVVRTILSAVSSSLGVIFSVPFRAMLKLLILIENVFTNHELHGLYTIFH